MKSQIEELDQTIRLEKGNTFILLGEDKEMLDEVYLRLLNNYCRQEAKCIYIKKNNTSVFNDLQEIIFKCNSEENLTIDDYDLTEINISVKSKKTKAYLKILDEVLFDNIFIKIPNKHLNRDLFYYLGAIQEKTNCNFFLLPEMSGNKIYKKDYGKYENYGCSHVILVENLQDTKPYDTTKITVSYHAGDVEPNIRKIKTFHMDLINN